MLGRGFRAFGGRFGVTLKPKFRFLENFGDENLFRWKILGHFWFRKSDPVVCIRIIMTISDLASQCVSKSLVRKFVAVGSDRNLAFIYSGSAAVAAGQSVRRPRGARRGGGLVTPVIEN